ncbi:hypothetical protein ADEAN_000996600 [Angomonas deanei]|uniref:Uncharacterized protein n=1 Tax=Angomonas deanei TaxID=59799 RepID=A0A7G2CVS9_9TRYP|nr:hypothetical protein ADEAN_000996600 [Angomonas deanei]
MLEDVVDYLTELSATWFDGDEELLFYLIQYAVPIIFILCVLAYYIRKKEAKYFYAAEYEKDIVRDYETDSDSSDVPDYELSMEEFMQLAADVDKKKTIQHKKKKGSKKETQKVQETSLEEKKNN